MSDRLFKKIASVTVWRDTIPGAATNFTTQQLAPGQQLDVTDMRIKFRVDRSLTRTPNQCDVWISNLAAPTRKDLATLPLTVRLAAGYDGVARLLFQGDLHFGMSEIQRAGWLSLMQVGDGDRSYNYARVRRSYKSGTTVRTILRDAAASMGLTLPENLNSDGALDRQMLTGAVAHGDARDELTRLLAPFGYHWSVQNGELVVLRDDEVTSDAMIPVDQAHGMIGSPEFGAPPRSGKPPHVRVRMELYPEISPGDLVQVTSEDINGRFRVERVRHEGDTHEPQWETLLQIQPF